MHYVTVPLLRIKSQSLFLFCFGFFSYIFFLLLNDLTFKYQTDIQICINMHKIWIGRMFSFWLSTETSQKTRQTEYKYIHSWSILLGTLNHLNSEWGSNHIQKKENWTWSSVPVPVVPNVRMTTSTVHGHLI